MDRGDQGPQAIRPVGAHTHGHSRRFEIFTLRAEKILGNRLAIPDPHIAPTQSADASAGPHHELRSQHTGTPGAIAEAVDALADRYWNNEPVEDLVSGLTDTFDTLIIDLWRQHFNDTSDCALFAVGGYGRANCIPVQISIFWFWPKNRSGIEKPLKPSCATSLISMSKSVLAIATSKPALRNVRRYYRSLCTV